MTRQLRSWTGSRKAAAAPALCILVAGSVFATDARAQDADLPRFPFGTPVVFTPVQSVAPLPDGTWPGGSGGEEDALRAMDAELEYALERQRGAENWALPDDVVRRVGRNPMLRMDPRRMAYQGLVEKPDKRDQIYEPLHSELRSLAALFDTRYVVLPIALRTSVPETDAAGSDTEPTPLDGAVAGTAVRATLLLALIDIRSSTVVWHGEISGEPAEPDSPALLASLAENVAKKVAPS